VQTLTSTLAWSGAVAASLLLGGCSTPRPARELASQGAVMADQARSQANAFIDRAGQAYGRREAIVRELARGEIADTTGDAFRSYIAAQAGVQSRQVQVDLVKGLAEHSRVLREHAETALAAHDKALADAAGPAVTLNSAPLADVKRSFLVLSQELTPAEWVKFARSYLTQVNQELKALEAKGAGTK
jgi:hypothetical protein